MPSFGKSEKSGFLKKSLISYSSMDDFAGVLMGVKKVGYSGVSSP